MSGTLNITSGDSSGSSLAKSGVPGEVFVWHDILYDGPRKTGWPDDATLNARARFLEQAIAGGLDRQPKQKKPVLFRWCCSGIGAKPATPRSINEEL